MITRPEVKRMTLFGIVINDLPVEDVLLYAEYMHLLRMMTDDPTMTQRLREEELQSYFAALSKLHRKVGKI